jgi:hypothetical protein
LATTPLIPQLQSLHEQLAQIKREVEEGAGKLTPVQLNWSPDQNTWSVAQVLEHLDKVGELLMPALRAGVERLKSKNLRSDGPFRYGLIGRWFIRMLSPNPPFKVPVPPVYTPGSTEAIQDFFPRFLKLQDDFQAVIQAANGFDLRVVKVVSPASRAVRLSVGAWLEAMAAHEQYHLLQVRALLAHPNFPKN